MRIPASFAAHVNKNLLHDVSAGLVVFLIALPLCLGIALASQAPIVAGILAGIVGGIVVGALSGSHTSVAGPAAGLTAIIAAQISSLGSFEIFLAALIVAGVIQIIMGLARIGFIAAFFPSSVIKGLLAAIGFILLLKQLPHLVGFDIDYWGDFSFLQADQENTFSELIKMLFNVHAGATLVGISSLILLLGWERSRFSSILKIPGPLVVVLFGTLFSLLLPFLDPSLLIQPEHRVQVPVIQSIHEMQKLFTWPDFSALLDPRVLMAGIAVAVVASLETLLNLEAVDKIDPRQRKSPPNRELLAQGVGNLMLGLIGGLPVTSVVIRSSVNINANAKSKKSTIFHGLLLLSCAIILPNILNHIPLSCLAAILILTGYKLASPKIAKQLWRQGWSQFFPFLITFSAIVLTDLLMGVSIGFAVSLLFILHRNLKGPIRLVKENCLGNEITRLILPNQVNFLNRASLRDSLAAVPDGSHLIIDAEDTDHIDADVLDLIRDFKEESARARDIPVNVVGLTDSCMLDHTIPFAEHATREMQKTATADQILSILMDGNQRVRDGRRLKRDLTRQIRATSSGQFPFAVFLSCIDSRASVELIFDLGIGDAFSVRMAGNVISEKVLGSLEFACAVAGAKLIVVMGHTRCGAISAAVNSFQTGISAQAAFGCEHLGVIVSEIHQVIEASSKKVPGPSFDRKDDRFHDHIAKENVLACIERIKRESRVIADLLRQGQIGIAGCLYNVGSGAAEFLEIPGSSMYQGTTAAKKSDSISDIHVS